MKFGTNRRYQKILIIKEKYNENYFYFINCLFFSILKHGKKFLALKLFLNILNLLKKKFKQPSLFIFKLIRRLLHSKIYIKIQHVGPIPYAIPVMSLRKSIFLSKIWLLSSARIRVERTSALRIFSEICDIKKNKKSGSILKKFQYYNYIKQSQTNLKFLRYIKLKNKLIVNTKFNFNKIKNFTKYRLNKYKLNNFLWNIKKVKNSNYYFNKFKKLSRKSILAITIKKRVKPKNTNLKQSFKIKSKNNRHKKNVNFFKKK